MRRAQLCMSPGQQITKCFYADYATHFTTSMSNQHPSHYTNRALRGGSVSVGEQAGMFVVSLHQRLVDPRRSEIQS